MATNPLAGLSITAFGPFEDIEVPLAPGLNVIVGDNSTGKSQLLKVMYSSTKSLKDAESLTKKTLSSEVASKLLGVFRPQKLGRLTRRQPGRVRANVGIKYTGIRESLEYSFATNAENSVKVENLPDKGLQDEPVFIPSHELLSYGAEFLALYDTYDIDFDETVRDTVELLFRPVLRGRNSLQANTVLKEFADMLQGGSVIEEDGKFLLKQPGIGKIEAPLLAEGHRKLAMITRLISNGVLLEGGYLFWDEPEANLNPASQRAVARSLLLLAATGSQIFIATHSTFLVRELQMQASEGGGVEPKFIGLSRTTSQGEAITAAPVRVDVADSPEGLEVFAALEAEAEQAERYLSW